jgi:membrane protein implicated in regulation of membrane protease activity
MRPNPFIRINRAAETAGYPALLVVTVVCLAIVVAGVALLALVETPWAFAMAILSLIAAVAILSAAMMATLFDAEEPVARGAVTRSSSQERGGGRGAAAAGTRRPAAPARPKGRVAAQTRRGKDRAALAA